jgi:hypothetical protein
MPYANVGESPLLRLGLSHRVGTLAKTPSNLNPQRMFGGYLPYRTGTQSNGRARCDEENSAASSEVGRV